MAKANMVLPDGTKITIHGNPDEVAHVLKKLSQSQTPQKEPTITQASHRTDKPARRGSRVRRGPTQHVLELRDENFFKSRRTLPDIQTRLEEKGHIYAQSSLSPIVVRLVRKKEIRRLKDKKGWVYVS